MDDRAKGKGKKVLRPFFEALDHGFQKSMTEKYSIYASIGGRKLELCFSSQKQAEIIERCLAGRMISETSETDACFCFWTDDCSRYIRKEKTSERWRLRDENGWIVSVPDIRLVGADVRNRLFYYCLHSPKESVPIPYWALSTLIYQWAGLAGLLPVHGGAVGTGGDGVLLAAGGGGGKSTLAAACLLSGMEYVADDYLLLSEKEPLMAMPLFSTLKMHLDMKEHLNIKMPVIYSDRSRGGKQLLDASAFPICGKLRIRGVVFLRHTDWNKLAVSPLSGSIAVRLTQTVLQEVGTYDPAVARSVIKRLSGLPAYEMSPGRNLKQNAEMICKIIERIR